MKTRKAWRWIVTYPDGTRWWGYCPAWAGQSMPAGAVLTRQRVLALGTPKPCQFPGCTQLHVPLPSPF